MSVTVNLSAEEVAQIKRFTDLENEGEAVTKAAREYLRVIQLRELKAASGNVDYGELGQEMEALELREDRSNAARLGSGHQKVALPRLFHLTR